MILLLIGLMVLLGAFLVVPHRPELRHVRQSAVARVPAVAHRRDTRRRCL
jgi:hypothetical protein